ncbi:uncharacterized protein LOC144443786 [Glandiceps talaboti]
MYIWRRRHGTERHCTVADVDNYRNGYVTQIDDQPISTMERSLLCVNILFLVVLIASLVIVVSCDEANLVGGKDSGSTDTFDCYFCSTSHGQGGVDGECGLGFEDTDILRYKNCAGVCTKNVVYDSATDEIHTINRLCESECSGNNHCTEVSHGKKTCTYCCTGELCNSATNVCLSTTLVLIMAIQMLVFVF